MAKNAPKKSVLKQAVADLLHDVEQNISEFMRERTPECLHNTRVGIKKIKALLSFAEVVYREKYDASTLKPLFDESGKIREIQINIQLLRILGNPPRRIITSLEKKESQLTQRFLGLCPQFVSLLGRLRKNVCLPDVLPDKKTINKYFKTETKKVRKAFKIKDRENAHQYRTKLKRLMYVYSALPGAMQTGIDLSEAQINKQQQKLGEWHDTYSAIEFFSRKHSSGKTAQYILKLKERERRQFNALFKK